MTVDQLHDAIGLLPADLLAETDRLRQAPRREKKVLWKPVLAMAACLALALTGWLWWFQPMGSTETAQDNLLQAAAGAPENRADAVLEDAPFRSESLGQSLLDGVSTPRLTGQPSEPAAVLLQSWQDWQDYRSQNGEAFDLSQLDSWMTSLEEDWFDAQDLVLIRVEQVPIGETPQVQVLRQETGVLEVEVAEYPPVEDGFCWHMVLPLEKNTLKDGSQIGLQIG